MENNIIIMPENITIYNGQNERCDMLVGPCSCGAWHRIEDWIGKIENVEQYITKSNGK